MIGLYFCWILFRLIFLLDSLPNSEKIHVEKFILSRIEKYYAEEAMQDSLNVTD